jgi:putative ABC transport system permease protein
MATIAQDLRYALRRMQATPVFTIAATATFALGLGANSAMLSLAHAIFLKPLPVPDASRVVMVDATIAGRPTGFAYTLAYPDYLYYREHARTFESLAAHYGTSPMQIVTPDGGVSVTGSVATANYFTALRLQPAAGRFFTEEEDRVRGRDAIAVLSDDLWRHRFGADRSILGSAVRINGTPFIVIGIAPAGFRGVLGPQDVVDVWIPTAMFSVGYRYCDGFARDCRIVSLIGRLADGATLNDAQSEMTMLARQVETAFPKTNEGRGLKVRPARGIRVNEQTTNKPILSLIAVAAALVLFVSAANVAGLLLARGLQRRKEIALQLALGASQSRLCQQLLVESALLSVAGGAAGLITALWSTDIARTLFRVDLALNLPVIAAGFAIALATGIVTGLGPALQATRRDALPALKDERSSDGRQRTRVRDALIVAQVAVSVVLLTASGLVVRSFLNVHRGPGFDPDRVIVTRLRPSLIGYSADRSWAFQREVIRRLEGTPGVIAASPADVPPLPRWRMGNAELQIAAAVSDRTQPAVQIATTPVGPRYFKTLGVPVVEGREFDERDTATTPRRAIVNETLARRVWPRGGAAGSVVRIDGEPVEIVGVVKSAQYVSVFAEPQAVAYFNYWQQDSTADWSHDSRTQVRVAGEAAAMIPTVLSVIASVDPDVPISEARPLSALLDDSFADLRAARTTFLTFGALTLMLGAIGLYGALAFAVGQRRREIAIRLALGATRPGVGTLVLRQGAVVVLLGLAVGLAISLSAGRVLAHMLYGVSPRDPLTFLAGPSILVAVALLAIWLPARRAMAMDPTAALRAE